MPETRSERLEIRIEPSLKRAIRDYAEERDRSIADLIHDALARATDWTPST